MEEGINEYMNKIRSEGINDELHELLDTRGRSKCTKSHPNARQEQWKIIEQILISEFFSAK